MEVMVRVEMAAIWNGNERATIKSEEVEIRYE